MRRTTLHGLPEKAITIRLAALRRGCSERTIRNHIEKGYYQVWITKDGAYVDLDEMEAALAALPASKVRPRYGSFGANAVVHHLGDAE